MGPVFLWVSSLAKWYNDLWSEVFGGEKAPTNRMIVYIIPQNWSLLQLSFILRYYLWNDVVWLINSFFKNNIIVRTFIILIYTYIGSKK